MEIKQEKPLITYNPSQEQYKGVVEFENQWNQYTSLPMDEYRTLKPNFTEIPDVKRSLEEKARLLARAAMDSLTPETYAKGTDGIQYLADNIDAGVMTALTEPYKQAILKKAGITPNLSQARRFIAQERGIIV